MNVVCFDFVRACIFECVGVGIGGFVWCIEICIGIVCGYVCVGWNFVCL